MLPITLPDLVLGQSLAEDAPHFSKRILRQLRDIVRPFSIALAGPGDLIDDLAATVTAPVLPICVDENEVLCGPLFIPGKSACAACLKHWLSLRFYDRPRTPLKVAAQLDEILTVHLERWGTEFRDHGHIGALTDSAIAVAVDRQSLHPVFRRPNCAWCGGLGARSPSQRIHCSPWTGIVQHVDLTTTPVAGAFRATGIWAPPRPKLGARPELRRQRSYGRGRTRGEAEAGCIGEALERYSLIYRGDEPLVRARIADIDAIHPADIMLFSAAQYASRDDWNATTDELFHVPTPLDPEVAIDWLAARPLVGDSRPRYVPAAIALMWYEFRPGEPEFARADTIGCAAGVTFDGALYNALLEWVERDAMAIWWDNCLRRPAINVAAFGNRDLDTVVGGLRAIGRSLVLLDCTTDIGIPVYVAVAARDDGTEPLVAGAADLDGEIAAYRAASEVGQVWYEARRSRGLSAAFASWLLREQVADHSHLSPSANADPPTTGGTPRKWEAVVERLASVGLNAFSVDLSRDDVSIHTVRAVVPGMRHVWNRRAPGRLYEVPVKMGWRDHPLREDDLNPVRCMV
jgi:oxazoline/thiazoline synthase